MLNELTSRTRKQVKLQFVNQLYSQFEIPKDKYTLLGQFHNSGMGHFGVDVTIKKLQANNWEWPYMRHHVKEFIKKCPICQKMSATKTSINVKPFSNATLVPMERISMDTIGPLPISEDGFEYILVIIDCFTRFVEIYPTKTVNAEECGKILLQHIGRYGAPKQILSDNGTQFINGTIKSLLEMVGTEHLKSLANSKEETAIVERCNKEVLRHIIPMIYHERILETWQHYLPMVQRIMNAKEHEVTKVAPAKLLFGPAIDLDTMLYPEETEEGVQSSKC
jgi:hypothetical protein